MSTERPPNDAETSLASGATAVAALREINRFLDAVVENIPDMIFVKDAERLVFQRFNRAGEELLGWSRDELIGKTDLDFYPREEAERFRATDRETLARGALIDVEEPIETRHNGRRWLHTRKVPVYGDDGRPLYLLGISEDITDKKLAQDRARALERELAELVRHAREAVVAWTAEGVIVGWNPGAEVLYGLTVAEAIGAPLERILPEALRDDVRAQEQRLLAGERLPIIETYRLRGAEEVEIEESLFLVESETGRRRFASIAREVGELARLRRATEILGRVSPTCSEQPLERGERIRATLAAADLVAADPIASVLILGETGVGKSWMARRIHGRSPRASRPLFELNCASLSRELMESELFGHERGAFTGATVQKRGIVEVADGGTLFLDEVGELPPEVQAQLLTFLDSGRFRRVGGSRVLSTSVRLITATNVDLESAVRKGAFRRDLYYRLRVVPIVVPPLRERRDEIAGLAQQLLEDLVSYGGRSATEITPEAFDVLEAYGWPGNVRELRNALERALILSRGGAIRPEHLPLEPFPTTGAHPVAASLRLADVERAHILRVLELLKGNRTHAAERLGISRSTLKKKLAEMDDPSR